MMLIIALFILSYTMTWALRRRLLFNQVLDIPNHRSAHTTPTPRGGGIAFVVCFSLWCLGWYGVGIMSTPLFMALFFGGLLVAAVGFMDDYRSIKVTWRLTLHFAAMAWGVCWLSTLFAPSFVVPGMVMIACFLVALLYGVWLLNLYNFMDGIDGIAATEAISVCFCMAFLYQWSGISWIPLGLGAAVAGFLCWNFPRARIFMGDAGSGFLGYILAICSLHSLTFAPRFFVSWFIMLGVFIVDASLTLLRRVLRGSDIFQGHCEHAYQHAARHDRRHVQVTCAILMINMLWLFPWAAFVSFGTIPIVYGLIIAYTPLVLLAFYWRAGLPEV